MIISKQILGILVLIVNLCIFIPAFYAIIKSIIATLKAKEWQSVMVNLVVLAVGLYFFLEILGVILPAEKWLDSTLPLGANSEFIASMSDRPTLRACCGIGGVVILVAVILYALIGGFRMVSKKFKEKQTAKGVLYSVFFVSGIICLTELTAWFFPMSKWF